MKRTSVSLAASIWILAFVLLFVYALAGIPSKEGLNPSDDGVILAQSFRLLQGEIPHKDFISIRPVGSAVLHSISLLLPFPLELTARWLVLFQYFIYSLFFTLAYTHRASFSKQWWLPILVLVSFVFNQNHYNLFPWTTIDALLWISMAFWAYVRLDGLVNRNSGRMLYGLLVVFASVMAALSRQTFALPALVLLTMWIRVGAGRPYWKNLLVPLILGALPVLVYGGVLMVKGGVGDFIRQMTGRTEFFETAILGFWRSFMGFPLVFALIVSVEVFVLDEYFKTHEALKKKWQTGVLLFAFSLLLLLMVVAFIKPTLLFALSFGVFWLALFLLLMFHRWDWLWPRALRHTLFLLLVAWTSAISLGDNAPVFSMGMLVVLVLVLILQSPAFLRYDGFMKVPYAGIVLGVSVLILSLVVQPRVNYRDRPAEQLKKNAGEIFSGLDGIRVNDDIYAYLSEINEIWIRFGKPDSGFAVLPNNALLYPVMGIRNPFPLDWMQRDEFIGSEKELLLYFEETLNKPGLVILLERYNVKWLANELTPLTDNKEAYPWYDLLVKKAEEIQTDSFYFRVFVTQ